MKATALISKIVAEYPEETSDAEWLGTFWSEVLSEEERDAFRSFGEFEEAIGRERTRFMLFDKSKPAQFSCVAKFPSAEDAKKYADEKSIASCYVLDTETDAVLDCSDWGWAS